MTEKGLTTRDEHGVIDYESPKMIATLKSTVAVGLTNEEFALFAQFCKGTGLNPFKKEIWAIKAGNRLQLMTGINGYWAIANAHKEFDGAESGMISKTGEWVKSVPGNDFLGAWCRVYRKDRKIAMEGEAFLSDYRRESPLWKSSPRIMIKKVAESVALRKAFPQELNGTYTAEEMPPEFSNRDPIVVTSQPAPAPQKALDDAHEVLDAEPVERVHYQIPYKEKQTWKPFILQAGGGWDAATKTWWSPTAIPEISQYAVDLAPDPAVDEPHYDNDELPNWG